MRLDLETDIRFREGERVGRIVRVVLDEESNVKAIVVATGELISRNIVVPLEMLSEGPGGVTTFNGTDADLDGLETYEEERVPMIPDGWRMSSNAAFGGDVFPTAFNQPIVPVTEVANLRSDLVGVSQGTEVRCLDGAWGIVDEVLVDGEGHAYAIVGRPYATEEGDRIIPLELITEVGSEFALLNCSLADLPTYSQETRNEHEEPEPR
jgi:hypothetical protein